jgi:UDP-N-acetylglucosamine 2-epimerase (non-hydrolysing)
MKAAPVLEELRKRKPEWDVCLLHTGQHYDEKLSNLFFHQLGMPEPDVNLGIGSGSHAEQTARIMIALESHFSMHLPNLVIVFGDVNSTLAAALVASKMQIPIAHVEAGLRSFDRTMPEEINRVITDTVSDWLFITERSAEENLWREGISPDKIHFVGNTMIDTLFRHLPHALALQMPSVFQVTPGRYAVVTLHRPSNVDRAGSLQPILFALQELADLVPVIFPVHPRTSRRIKELGLGDFSDSHPNLHLVEPLGYLEFIGVVANAGVVLTDSGGIQEETTILKVPCVTLRNNTERPVTLTEGTNVLVGNDAERILQAAHAALNGTKSLSHKVPEKWDGKASERIVELLSKWIV